VSSPAVRIRIEPDLVTEELTDDAHCPKNRTFVGGVQIGGL
jgi:hypothetical protein